MRHAGSRRRRVSIRSVLLICALCTVIGLFMLTTRPIEPSDDLLTATKQLNSANSSSESAGLGSELSSGSGGLDSKVSSGGDGLGLEVSSESGGLRTKVAAEKKGQSKPCATVEEMGEVFKDGFYEESLRVRELIRAHFDANGAARVRDLPPEQFCKHGFVLGKASEAGFGNEMYKVLTGAALSVMLNRSLIIGQTRGRFPFGEFISYSNISFTLREVKHLWNQNGCMKKYGRELVIGVDDFIKPSRSNILCSNWRKWEHPIIWLQNTTDALAAQFFLKNIHSEMREAASSLFGHPESVHLRPNVYGELMKILISPSPDVEEAVNWVLRDGEDPLISLHMRMLMYRSVRATQAALDCIKKAMGKLQLSKPRVVVVSDNPSFLTGIAMNLSEFAEVLQFDYKLYRGNISLNANKLPSLEFRYKDWGPSPRWVAFVDFFLASRAKYAVITGAQRRVGTTYAQLIAGLAAANNIVPGDESRGSKFLFLSSFQSNLLAEGLSRQVGWGHVWNRYAGPLSCHGQPHQCAYTPLLPPAWYDDLWQSPIPRDIRRLGLYGIKLSEVGAIDQDNLLDFCNVKKRPVKTLPASFKKIKT